MLRNCNGTTPILHKEIENRIKVTNHNKKHDDNKNFFGKGLMENGYIFNYEKSMLTYDLPYYI